MKQSSKLQSCIPIANQAETLQHPKFIKYLQANPKRLEEGNSRKDNVSDRTWHIEISTGWTMTNSNYITKRDLNNG